MQVCIWLIVSDGHAPLICPVPDAWHACEKVCAQMEVSHGGWWRRIYGSV